MSSVKVNRQSQCEPVFNNIVKWAKNIFGLKQKDQSNFEKKVIFVVGVYKCGTSWLSYALGKHPQAMALPELDVIRAFAKENTRNLHPRSVDERIKYIFSASNYGRLPAAITNESCGVAHGEMFDYFEQNANKQIILKNSLTGQEFDRQRAFRLTGQGCGLKSYLNYWQLDKASAEKLFATAIFNSNPKEAIRAFCKIHQDFSGEFLVLKSADQINHLGHLKDIMPNSPRILIIRDGRDMAISATKFEQYVREKTHFGDIWGVVEQGFWRRLEQWVHVVHSVNEYEKHGDLYVLRYEDLSFDFLNTFSKLLDWIGLDSSKEIVEEIKRESSFEKMSGGRSKGCEDMSSNIRKGISGEWRSFLSKPDKEKAWEIAGKELATFGYEKL
jgi:hypothetical protein